MAKMDYKKVAAEILSLVGGKENITEFMHCMTRLRFKVKDTAKIDENGLKALDAVSGCLWSGDQYHVVVGNAVNSLYDEVCALGEFEKMAALDENPDAAPGKTKKGIKGALKGFLSVIAACIVPNLGLFVGMGLFAAVLAIIGPTGFNIAPEDSAVYKLFNCLYNGIAYFIPVALGLAAAKRFKTDEKTTVMALCMCLFPDLIAAVSSGEIGILPVTLKDFGISAILIVYVLSLVEKLIKKILPDSLKFVFSTFLTLVIVVPLSIFLIVPVGFLLGYVVAVPVQALGSISQPLLALVVGALWVPLISVGMHAAMAGLFMLDFMTVGVNYTLMPAMYSLAFIGMATDLAIAIRAKNADIRKNGRIGILNYLTGGIAEPSIYSVYINNPKTMIAISAGMGVTGFYMSLVQAGAYSIAANNVLSLLTFLAGGVPNLLKALPGIGIGMAVSFAIIMIFGVESRKKEA